MDIRIQNLTMRFDNITAVNQLSTTIKDGELVSLLGPSGCGKSTTLMLLSGLYKPTSGRIYFGNQDVTELDAEKRQVGMVFQNYALYPHLSVLKNIMFPLKMKKMNKIEARAQATEMAELLHIDHLLSRKPGQLSGGQQQRVAIARALVKKPNVLLLDEPLSNLDARLRLEMREEIRRIQQEVGITAVFVTHDQEEALSISDRVMVMNNGVLQQDSEPQQMYKKPANEFVASFLGNPPINFITVERHRQNEHYKIKHTAQPIHLSRLKHFDRTTLKMGIRPESLFVTTQNNSLFRGDIIHIETIGRDTLIRVDLGESTVRALVDPKKKLQIGDVCFLGAEEEEIHYFSSETGERLKGGKVDDDQTDLEEYA